MLDIYEYDYKNDSWKPYLTDDLQVELVMLNPYIRSQLKHLSSHKPTYYLNLKVFTILCRHLKNGEFSNLSLITIE